MTKKDIPQQIQSLINHFNAKNFDHVILKGKTLIKKNIFCIFSCKVGVNT